ncbi:MAG: FAD-dependent monooxygenase, partial [Pseudorhodobacter sp.]|nr:FAD-dependent monooxygenase [Frankiaceae bacterium]
MSPQQDADVVVVGAGPGGSATAQALAEAGLDVLLLEKASFPREKVCGDGLTPRAVKTLLDMGIDTSPAKGFIRNRGLRIIGGDVKIELPWPELASWPDYGLVRPRLDFDELI